MLRDNRFQKINPPHREALYGILLTLGLLILILGLGWITSTALSWSSLEHLAFIIAVLGTSCLELPIKAGKMIWILPWRGAAIGCLGIAAGIAYIITHSTFTAWATLITIFALFLVLDRVFTNSKKLLTRWIIHAGFALAAGVAAVAISQIEAKFADEEFFVTLQGLALAVYWLFLNGMWSMLSSAVKNHLPQKPKNRSRGLQFKSGWLSLIFAISAAAFFIFVIHRYQNSFFPEQVPSYPGITSEDPFLCGTVPADTQKYDGRGVFSRLLTQIEANPDRGTPEYGLLALSTGKQSWAEAFRHSLLEEALRGIFTKPANSVKSVQFDAALRVYFYPRVLAQFPGLFTLAEREMLGQWFAGINRRALTVEWVDWMYAVAFSKLPEGPYENQENGAGLLALLEANGLADPNLAQVNIDYLTRNPRGWLERFRVTDDSVVYQPEWIDNAYFQSLYSDKSNASNQRLSFEWLLLQALPDGAPLKYNHVSAAMLDGISYLGAQLLKDSSYIWMAGRTLDYDEVHKLYVFAQPGLEKAIDLMGESPTQGSCLIYGDSGLPNQEGPLAPDKLVFRDGWTKDSTYLLLDLRFTGWHRYKATNAVSLVYQDGPLIAEKLSGEVFRWLPTGRNLFRDKRVPRENLNGLVIARTGMSAVLYTLTGFSGPWAQDPPYYTSVEQFSTGPEVDTSTTVLSDWRGWTHRRTIDFYHEGPIVVIDYARGPDASSAAFVWQLPEGATIDGKRFTLRGGDSPAEMVLIPIKGDIRPTGDTVQVKASGRLALVTVFLMRDWVGSAVKLDAGKLQIAKREQSITLPIVEEVP